MEAMEKYEKPAAKGRKKASKETGAFLGKAALYSKIYYNEALIRAKERDLTNAISLLKLSLQLDKKNIDARNLLGLIYNEIGEISLSLIEWIFSDYYKKEDNRAKYYLSYYDKEPASLDNLKTMISKYNLAIKTLRQNSTDYAMMYLKNAISLKPHFLKALQLLGLLCIKEKKYSDAKHYLTEAAKIDICNPLTQKYLKELESIGYEKPKEVKPERVLFANTDYYAPASSYKERNPFIIPILSLVGGGVLGLALFALVAAPGIRMRAIEGKVKEIIALNEGLAEANANISELEGKNNELEKVIEGLKRKEEAEKVKEKEEEVKKEEAYTENLFMAVQAYVEGDEKLATEQLLKTDKETFKEKEAKLVYETLSRKLFEKQAVVAYKEGRSWYNKGRFDKALPRFLESMKMNPLNVDTIFFIGRSYDRLGEKDEAKKWYEKVVLEFADSQRALEANQKLRLLGGS